MSFERTDKQKTAALLMNRHDITVLKGGSGSGKTFAIIHRILLRAIKAQSTHLIVRFNSTDARRSLAHGTIPEVVNACFPQLASTILGSYNKQENYYQIPNIEGGISELWLGGIQDKERLDKALGTSYSTIYLNEASQMSLEAFTILRTRLREQSSLSLRMFIDYNPPSRRHWLYKLVEEEQYPTGEKHKLDIASLQMNPDENPFLPSEYVESLKKLPKYQRERFFYGRYASVVPGALWTVDDIHNAITFSNPPEPDEIVVGVDPSVTDKETSDECGIIVAARAGNNLQVLADYSGKMSPNQWALKALQALHDHNASRILVEVNNGGDLVEQVIRHAAGQKYIKIDKVRASQGKLTRAEPIQLLYEQGKVYHAPNLTLLEEELTSWIPGTSKSPNRLDALVWAASHLMLKQKRTLAPINTSYYQEI